MLWLYNIGIQLYALIILLFSTFNTKARFFVRGRADIFNKIRLKIDPAGSCIWFHFASLGEFEQGRPVLESIKNLHPEKKIIITFFSPSGYEIRKDFPLAEGIFYLPLDTARNAKKFIACINPEVAIFTKYEYWYHYFKQLSEKSIPIFIISGIFRPNQIYFKWYGAFNRNILGFVTHFFLQNEESEHLLKNIGIKNISISGDTRFDRVAENARSPKSFSHIQKFCNEKLVCVAGSTWAADENLLVSLAKANPLWKFIIAPHEIDEAHLNEIQKLIPDSVRYSKLQKITTDHQILIIDNIGLLSALYQYGNIAYVGGGFGAGIHNILEAAAFGLPVIFGPKYHKFKEAKDLVSLEAAIGINNSEELRMAFQRFTQDGTAGKIAKKYVYDNTGATSQIVEYLQQYLFSS